MTVRKLFTVIVSVVLAVSCSCQVFAKEKYNPDAECSLKIVAKTMNAKDGVKDIDFSVYFVADAEYEDGELSYDITSNFLKSGLLSSDFTETSSVAVQLKRFVEEKKLKGKDISTDEKGEVIIDSCKSGIYLVVPKTADEDSAYLTSQPFIVAMPSYFEGKFNYDIICFSKLEKKFVKSINFTNAAMAQNNSSEQKTESVNSAVRWIAPFATTLIPSILTFALLRLIYKSKRINY